MQTLTPKLGSKVVSKAFLLRKTTHGMSNYGQLTRLKSWERIEPSEPITGFYVGRRMKSNGNAEFLPDGGGVVYEPVAYFEAWLVAYADNRDILICLPKDVHLYKGDVA